MRCIAVGAGGSKNFSVLSGRNQEASPGSRKELDMTSIAYSIDLLIISWLGILGLWLESINGKQGFLDELLAPAPLAAVGGFVIALETLAQ
jgi:hypothetical protein